MLYLDDLHVGMRFTSGEYPLDRAQIEAFARQFDPQPFHVDPVAAKDSLFAGQVASGWHTAAITMRLLVESGWPIAGGLVGVSAELRWPRPTRPGDVLHVEGEILDVRPSRSRPTTGLARLQCKTVNQHGEPVQLLTATLYVPRRPAAGNS